jgi:antitoxin component of MazEF toxin-antitoxin module
VIASRIRKAGNSYVVTIPPREMAARGLREGQLVGFDPVPLELRPAAPPQLSPDEEADMLRWVRQSTAVERPNAQARPVWYSAYYGGSAWRRKVW